MLKRALGAALLAAVPFATLAQSYPAKPVRILVPHPPGGNTDAIARMLADKMKDRWNQPVVVENRPGAAGNIGAEAASKSPPDGHTLLMTVSGTLVINKTLFTKLAHDPDQFVPVAVIAQVPLALTVGPKVSATSAQSLVEFAKANPGKLNNASGGTGSVGHLAAEFFKSSIGANIVHVPYNGIAPAITDLAGGQIDLLFVEPGLSLPHVKTGKLRILAVGTEKRNPQMAEVPTLGELIPGFAVADWFGMVAPPGTPMPIATAASAAVADALKQPDVAKRLADLNIDVVGSSPEEMGRRMATERERWGKVIRAGNIKVE